jgi:phenylacetate-CoA ligase
MERLAGLPKLLYSLYLLGPGSRRVLRHYAWIQWYRSSPEDQRQAARDELFRKLVHFAYQEVPFYRRLYDENNVDLKGINGVEDVTKLPLVSREMMQEVPLEDLRPGRFRKIAVSTSTSGSSGTPFVFYRSLSSVLFYGGQLLNYLDSWGFSAKRKVYFILYNADPTISFNLSYRSTFAVLNRRHSIDPLRPTDTMVSKIESDQPDLIISHPSTVEDIADWLLDRRRTYDKPIGFATGGEVVTERLLFKVAKAFPASQYFDFYNTVEAGLVAAQCACSDLFHVNENSVILEKGEGVRDDTGEQYVKPIFTNLWNYGTPFIRYTGIEDLLQFAEEAACDCGSNGRLIRTLVGRESDIIRSPDTKGISACNLMSAHADLPGVRRFQYVQRNPEELILRYIPSAGADHGAIRREAEAVVRRTLGPSIRFTTEAAEEVYKSPKSLKVPIVVRQA